ncbi:transposon TX1 [Tanacetum coccineum]
MGKLWMVFKKYGTVYDMFMVKKRLKNGHRYGFVRFKNFRDVEVLHRALCGIRIGGMELQIYKAYDRKSGDDAKPTDNGGYVFRHHSMPKHAIDSNNLRDGRKYKEVINEKPNDAGSKIRGIDTRTERAREHVVGTKNKKQEVKMEKRRIRMKEDIESDLRNRVVVGDVVRLDYLEKLHGLGMVEGIEKVEVKYIVVADTQNCDFEGHQSLIVGKVLVHTCNIGLIKDEYNVKIGKKMFKVTIVKYVGDITEIEAEEKEKCVWDKNGDFGELIISENEGSDEDDDECDAERKRTINP